MKLGTFAPQGPEFAVSARVQDSGGLLTKRLHESMKEKKKIRFPETVLTLISCKTMVNFTIIFLNIPVAGVELLMVKGPLVIPEERSSSDPR